MTEFVHRVGLGFLAEPWIARIIIILAVTAAANLLAEFLLRHVRRVTVRTVNVWDDALVGCASRPMLVVIWLIGLSLAVDILRRHVDEPFLEYVVPLRNIGIVLCLAWFLLRFIGRVSENIVACLLYTSDAADE